MKKIFIFFLIVITYIMFPLLIYFNIIDSKYKFYVLVIVGVISFIITRILNIKNLGITTKNMIPSIKRVIPFTLIVFVLSIIYYILGLSKYDNNETIYFYLFYIFISCPIQELLFRGILNEYLNVYDLNNKIKLIISSLLFSFLHVIYKDPLTLLLTLLVGLYWNYCYFKDRNLIGVTISHIVLGISTIFLGII